MEKTPYFLLCEPEDTWILFVCTRVCVCVCYNEYLFYVSGREEKSYRRYFKELNIFHYLDRLRKKIKEKQKVLTGIKLS